MYLPPEILKKLSTNAQKGLRERLDGQLHVRAGDTETGEYVLQVMRDNRWGWCNTHNVWHAVNPQTWTFEAYPNCPPSPMEFAQVKQFGQATEGNGEGYGPQAEGAGESDEQTDARIDAYASTEANNKQAKAQLREDGSLPTDMQQKGKDESLEKDILAQCLVYHEKFKCTLKKGHDGDHIAHWSDGSKAKRWKGQKRDKQEGQQGQGSGGKQHSWKRKLYNRCPQCLIETLNTQKMLGNEPQKDEERIIYSEKPCGCDKLKEMGIA